MTALPADRQLGEGFAYFRWHFLRYGLSECRSYFCWSNWYGGHRG